MNYKRVLLLAIAAIFAEACIVCLATGAESASGVENGIIAQERVVNLPRDSERWHLSIVGTENHAPYSTILNWFDEDPNLRGFKGMVHYHIVNKGTAIYNERYLQNLQSNDLPAVRLQKGNGEVVYEAAGKNLPLSAGGLYGALSDSINRAQGLGLFRPWWNRQRRPCPPSRPCPRPAPPAPPKVDPPPAPLAPNNGPPIVDSRSSFSIGSAGIGAGATLLLLFVGAGVGAFSWWRKTYRT